MKLIELDWGYIMKKITGRYVLSFVFNTKDPLFENELKEALKVNKYVLVKPFSYEEGPVSVKNLKIAEKNGCDIVYNPEVSAIFVTGGVLKTVSDLFSDLEMILKDKLEIDMDDLIRSYELISERQIKTRKKPQKMIDNYYKNCKLDSFNNIIGEDSVYYTIRLAANGSNPDSSNWHDLIIEPRSLRHYLVRYVYRNKDVNKFKSKVLKTDEIIENSIKFIEGGNDE